MAVGDRLVTDFENAGLYTGTSDTVQVAALGSGVFDYTQIYNTAESVDVGSLTTYCPLAWGTLAVNNALWQSQGSYYLARTAASAPVIFFYNTDDAAYYQDQIKHFKAKLDSLGVTTSVITNYGTGHAVPQTSGPLTTVYNFFNRYLTPSSVLTGINDPVATGMDMSLTLSPNPATDNVKLSFSLSKACKIQIVLFNLSGIVLSETEKHYDGSGVQSETIHLNELNLPAGIYFVKVTGVGIQGIKKFMKE
jgi:hypothetical protein